MITPSAHGTSRRQRVPHKAVELEDPMSDAEEVVVVIGEKEASSILR